MRFAFCVQTPCAMRFALQLTRALADPREPHPLGTKGGTEIVCLVRQTIVC
jgi:hypothetical protein